jgi:hypothetical protein
MKNRMHSLRWAARAAAITAGLLLVPGARAVAQGASSDPRWNAYVGCWEPAATPSGVRASLLCIVPTQGASAVDLVTITDGKEAAREHIDASGAHVANTRDGCTGWESAQWARDGERVYLKADYTCPGGVRQMSTALIALSANGDLMDVQGLKAGRNNGVRVTQYREANDPGTLPADIASAVGSRTMAVDAARVGASAPVSTDNVIDASAHLDAPVVEAWLANRGEEMSVDAKELEVMAKRGVPSDVIDVLVALSYPDRFAVAPSAAGGNGPYGDAVAPSQLKGVAGATTRANDTRPICPYSAYGWDYGTACRYSPWAYGYSPYGWDPYGLSMYGSYGYSPYYGAGAYGYGYGYGYGGWYNPRPVVIVQGNGGSSNSHGRVVKGRGYVQGSGASSGSSAGSRTSTPARSSGSSSSTGSTSSGKTGSSSSGSSSGRTAHRRGGGGGGTI